MSHEAAAAIVESGCASSSDESDPYLFHMRADYRDIIGNGGKSRLLILSVGEIAAMRIADYSRFMPGAPAGTS
jgi:hypothetical protein